MVFTINEAALSNFYDKTECPSYSDTNTILQNTMWGKMTELQWELFAEYYKNLYDEEKGREFGEKMAIYGEKEFNRMFFRIQRITFGLLEDTITEPTFELKEELRCSLFTRLREGLSGIGGIEEGVTWEWS